MQVYKFGDATKRFLARFPEALDESQRFAAGSAVVVWERSLLSATAPTKADMTATRVS